MAKKGSKLTLEHKAKISKSLLGNKRRLGIPHTIEVREKLSNFMKANPNKGQFKKGQIPFNKGKKFFKEIKQKMSKIAIGRVSSFKGKKHSEESKLKNRLSKLGKPNFKIRGKKNGMYGKIGNLSPAFNGGMSKDKYPKKFNSTLKGDIRRRDNYECQLCTITEREYLEQKGIKLSIHHIDYNKENCEEYNLITLCQKCNIKVNSNRDYWFSYFTYILVY